MVTQEHPTNPDQLHHTVARQAVAWFAKHQRPLLWRQPGVTAWGVLVSEVMSQQTQVARVEPLWQEWMRRWPKPHHLAAAATPEVLSLWGRLGYPRRALRLKECATVLANKYDDTVPADVETLLTLPGIGDYTARAVCAFAYQQAVPVVDTNVRRVIARAIFGVAAAGNPKRRDLSDAQQLVDAYPSRGHEVCGALMEIGALICTARQPHCDSCPLAQTCQWVANGKPQLDQASEAAAKKRRQPSFFGTDRYVRGIIMAALREHHPHGLSPATIDTLWAQPAQLHSCVISLVEDGLAALDDKENLHLPA
ncbi:A/G-specific adenine glycosylase [Corynebacterium choanae]|uniref:Adenine DNA glycosylase n=1 Tax=Corynebacterium choanae TaxID=1862358 RepID=A0A3G6J8I4_9CORY|nr:A/G-specific adenine glycosylase [Corynebacterium choanae]AZA12760.1 A/G-specific adenine glycosylase [Corynebacterium choanae]